MDARTSTKGPQKYYGVQSGKVPGVYTSWEEASAQITGQVKPRYKAFQTKTEAEEFVKTAGTRSSNGDDATQEDSAARDAAKKKKKGRESAASGPEDDSGYGPGEGPIPPDAEDFFDPSVKLDSKTGKVEYKTDEQLRATKSQAKGLSDDGMLRIWTDGSSRGNGTANAIAGVGVYFGPGDKRYSPSTTQLDAASYHEQKRRRTTSRPTADQPTRRADSYPKSTGALPPRPARHHPLRLRIRDKLRNDLVPEMAR